VIFMCKQPPLEIRADIPHTGGRRFCGRWAGSGSREELFQKLYGSPVLVLINLRFVQSLTEQVHDQGDGREAVRLTLEDLVDDDGYGCRHY
jgi:hypothetical protein